MRLLELVKPTTVYVLQRFISNEWRLIYFDEAFTQESIFADINWDSGSRWLTFSTKGACYRSTGLPGTFNKKEAQEAFSILKSHINHKPGATNAPIRLVEARVQVVSIEIDSCTPATLKHVDVKALEERRITDRRRRKSIEVPNVFRSKRLTSSSS